MAQIFPLINPGQVNFPSNQNVTVTNTPTVQVEGQDAAGNIHPLLSDAQGRTVVQAQDLLDVLQAILLELRAIRAGITSIATEGGLVSPEDLKAHSFQDIVDTEGMLP